LTSSLERPFEREFLRTPDEFYLSQGDVIQGVPLLLAPARFIFLDRPEREGEELRVRIVQAPILGESAYTIAQVFIADAVLLTYDCDIDRGLENIAGDGLLDPVESVTLAAALEVDERLIDNIRNIRAGNMPRLASIPETVNHPELVIDFSTVQQVSLRVLAPIAYEHRRHSMTAPGQLRLMELLAHALGDVFRRECADPHGDASLFRRACEALQGDVGA